MKFLTILIIAIILAVTAIAVTQEASQRSAATQIATTQSETQIALAESRKAIAGFQAAATIAEITGKLELARMQAETTRLGYQVELAQVNTALAQISADLERAQADRQRLWMMLILPSLATIAVIFVALVILVAVLKRPAAYPRITTVSREIVPAHPGVVGVVLATKVTKKQDADYFSVR
jgi:hypothetical protein